MSACLMLCISDSRASGILCLDFRQKFYHSCRSRTLTEAYSYFIIVYSTYTCITEKFLSQYDAFQCGKRIPELPVMFMDMPPQMFTNQARDISTMDNGSALEYLERVRQVDVDLWYQAATEYVSRLFSPFSIFVLVTIALLMNYRFKKNIFLFSLIQSLCTAVVYYVVQMLVSIMCEQGIIHPAYSAIIPVVTVLVLSLSIRFIGRMHG